MKKPAAPSPDLQTPFDAAVVIVTILRPSLRRAVRSVFNQDLRGRVQIMIGIDVAKGDPKILDELRAECPDNMAITVVNPGYSTAGLNGGLYRNRDGGSLRTILSFLANSRLVAYLDDDNWWAPHHLSDLVKAIKGYDYAFALRWLLDGVTEEILCVDDFGSVGPGRGTYHRKGFHGHIDTNCLMVDRDRCMTELWGWSVPFYLEGGSDPHFVKTLHEAGRTFGSTDKPSVYYLLDARGRIYPQCERELKARGFTPTRLEGPTPENFYRRRADKAVEKIEGPSPRRLRLAADDEAPEGWLTMTLAHGHPDILPLNPRRPLQFDAAVFDEVAIDGLLEKLTPDQAVQVLRQAARVLKPDGRLRVSTVDLRRLAQLLGPRLDTRQAGFIRDVVKPPRGAQKLPPSIPARVVSNRLFAYGHRHLFDLPSLAETLAMTGFHEIKECTGDGELEDGYERLVVEAKKNPNPRRAARQKPKRASA